MTTARHPSRSVRRAANVTLPPPLVEDAKAPGINTSQDCEKGLSVAWLKANRPALEAWNDHVEEHGTPLAEFRQF